MFGEGGVYYANLERFKVCFSMCLETMHSELDKSFKMFKHRFMICVKCPQSYIGEIPQKRQLSLILTHFQPQIKLSSFIPNLKSGFFSLIPQYLPLK